MWRALGCLLFTSMLAAPLQAFADEGKRPNVTTVTIAADDAEFAIVAAGLVEGLERFAIRVDTSRAPAVHPEEIVDGRAANDTVLARVWVDLSSRDEIVLFVTDRTGNRVLIHRFPRLGRAEIAREEAMASVQSTMDGLLHGAKIGVSVEDARRSLGLTEAPQAGDTREPGADAGAPESTSRMPSTEHSAPSSRSPSHSSAPSSLPSSSPLEPDEALVGLAVGYEVGGYADDLVEQGVYAAVSLRGMWENRTIGLRLSGQYRLPLEATTSPIAIRITTVALRGLAEVGLFPRRGGTDWLLVLGGGVDLAHAEPRALYTVDASLTPVSRADVVMRGGLAVRQPWRVLRRSTVVEVQAALDIAPFVGSFGVSHAGTSVEMVAPWPVRPLLTLGIAIP